MTRPLRIEYPGAIYHVLSRGGRRASIVNDDNDRAPFLALLGRTYRRTSGRFMHRRHIESLGISRDARVLEVGCGNGSMSARMAEYIALDGQEFSPCLPIVPFTVTKTHRQILLSWPIMLQTPGNTLPTSDYKAGVTIPGISGNR